MNKSFLFLLLMFFTGINAQATLGHDQGGGGDLCEDRIKIIRDDFKQWIVNGGPRSLSLPSGVSVDQYSSSMLGQMAISKIRCVANGDIGFPVEVNGTAKMCRFDTIQGQSTITCDYDKFQAAGESDQYILVHHEYAGLAGFEVPIGDDSNYTISNQITGYLEDQVVKKLVIKPTPPPSSDDPFSSDACAGTPITNQEFLSYFPPGGQGAKFKQPAKVVFRERQCLGNDERKCTDWKYTVDGQFTFLLIIHENKPLIQTEWFNGGYCGYGCIDTGFINGVTTSKIFFDHEVAMNWPNDARIFKFQGTGRFSKGCITMKSKFDLEHEAAFLLKF